MAWSSNKIVKHDLGENNIKGRIVSQERIDFIEAHAPKEITTQNKLYDEMSERIETTSNKSDKHADAVEVVRSLLDEYNYSLGTKLFDDDYEETLFEVYNSISEKSFEFDILLEVINDIVITNNLFTFCVMKNKFNGASIIITPIAIWEEEERFHPVTFNQILPDWLVEEDDNVYTVVDGITIAEARRKLLSLGFKEDPELAMKMEK